MVLTLISFMPEQTTWQLGEAEAGSCLENELFTPIGNIPKLCETSQLCDTTTNMLQSSLGLWC